MRKLIFITLFALFLLMLSPAAAQSKGTYLRAANLWSQAVNIYLNDMLIVETLASGETSAYTSLTAGTHAIRVTDADDTVLTTLDIAVGDGLNYTLVLSGQSRVFMLDETTTFRNALLQTSSPILIINATDTPLDVFYGIASATLQPDQSVATDMPGAETLFSVFVNAETVLQEQLSGVPNNYTLLAITHDAESDSYSLIRTNYSSLSAADFMRGLGIGGANGLNLAFAAFENASFADELAGTEPLTIFAPVNSAIDAIEEDTLDAWLESRILLETVMGFHLVAGDNSLAGATELTTLQGTALPITLADDGTPLIGGAHLAGSPYRVSNGIIYPIDTLLQLAPLPEVTVLP